MTQPAPKKSKAPLIVGLVAAGVLLCAGGITGIVVLGANVTPNSPTSISTTPALTTTGPIPTQAAPTTPKSLEVAFGETLVLTTSLGDEVEFVVSADKTYARTTYGTRPEKGIFYGIKAEVRVIKGSAYACFCDFALVAADGTAYESQGYGFAGNFNTVQLNAGQKTGGIIVFDVPATAVPGGRIELREGGIFGGGDQGFWKIP